MRLSLILTALVALAALSIPGAAESPPQAPSGCAVSGTFVPEEKGYFVDFQISYRVEGVLAEAFDDQVSQVRASRHYHLLEVVPGATEVRVSGSASGEDLGGSTQYAGSLTVELRVGDETESCDIAIERGSNPPYSFDVSLPIPAGIDPSVSFKITTGMRWPNGFFPIYVSGDMRPCPAEGCSDYCQSTKEVLEEEILEEEDEPIELSENAKLLKILDKYNSTIPRGIASSGSKNNILKWFNSTYYDYVCGEYQLQVLQLLDSLKWSEDPHERALLDGWDYGPIEALYGGHQAVVIYPKGTDWTDTGIVLDPWVDQRPKMYDIHTWAGMFAVEGLYGSIDIRGGSFHGIGGSKVYEEKPEDSVYPTVGGDYVDPKVTRLSEAEKEWIEKNLDQEKKKQLSTRFPKPYHKHLWIQMRMDEEKKNGGVMGYSPLNLYLVGDDGNISGFPGGVPTWEMEEILIKRFLLDDGTYWTELQYPQERSYNLVVEGTDDGGADLFMGYGMDGAEDRSVFRYQINVSLAERFEAPADSRGGPLYSGGRSVEAEEIQEINRSWLETKPDIVAPQEYEVTIEDGEISASTKAAASGPTVEEAAEPANAVDHNASEFVQWAAHATASEERTDEIVALYHFDGDADDATGRHPGELFGDASFTEGVYGQALKLDGSGDYVRVGNLHQDPTRDLSQGSIEMWINLESASTKFVLAGCGKEYGRSWDDGFYLGRYDSKNLVFMIWQGGWRVADSGIPAEDFVGVWRHVMGTWGPRGMEIWVDGILRGTNPHTCRLPNPNYSTALIGTDSWRWDAHGIIDEVMICDLQRTPTGSFDGPIETVTGRSKVDAGEFVQWAAHATASSEYSSSDWSALQASGEPDTYPDHGDIETAWATLKEDDGIQWLDLDYEVPVWISRVEIYETYNPGAITRIEIYDLDGERHLVWEGSMELARTARISTIDIDADFPSDRIRIILDTRRVSGWNEIDAVALIGSRSLPQSELWSYGAVLIDAPPGGWEGVIPGEAI